MSNYGILDSLGAVSELERRWVAFYVLLGDATVAARLAGYEGDYQKQIASELKSKYKTTVEALPDIMSMNDSEKANWILSFWFKTIADSRVKMRYRIDCSKLVADSLGMFKQSLEVDQHTDLLGEMTYKELSELVRTTTAAINKSSSKNRDGSTELE